MSMLAPESRAMSTSVPALRLQRETSRTSMGEYPNLVAVARALTGDRHDGEDLRAGHDGQSWWEPAPSLRQARRLVPSRCRTNVAATTGTAAGPGRLHGSSALRRALAAGPGIEFVAFWRRFAALPNVLGSSSRSTTPVIGRSRSGSSRQGSEGTVKSDLARARVVLMAEWGNEMTTKEPPAAPSER